MSVKNCIKAIPLSSISATTFTGAYQAINAGLPFACTVLRITNNTNGGVTISYDGVTDHDFIPTLTTAQINGQANAQPNNMMAQFKAGTIVYVKAAVGTGSCYLAGYYQPQGA